MSNNEVRHVLPRGEETVPGKGALPGARPLSHANPAGVGRQLRYLADVASSLVDYEEVLRSQTVESRLLYEAAHLLARTLDPDVIFDTLQEMIARVMDCDSLIVSAYHPENNLIRCSYAWVEGQRVDIAQFPAIPLAPEGRGMQSKVIRTGEPLLVGDVLQETRAYRSVYYANAGGTVDKASRDPEETRATVMVPIKLEGRVLGIVQVMSHKKHAYSHDHLRLLEALTIQVAAASRNAVLYRQATDEISERRRVQEENTRLTRESRAVVIQQRVFLRDVLFSVTEGRLRLCDSETDLPSPLSAAGMPIVLAPESLRDVRQRVQEIATAQGHCPERWQDLVTGVGEAAMNAVVHAGSGQISFGTSDGGLVQVCIEDRGGGIPLERLPRATLERGYTTAGSLGHGFSMILKTIDRVWLLTGPSGTTLVLEQDREAPEARWLLGL